MDLRTMKRLLGLTLMIGLLLVSCSNYESQLASKVKPNLKNGANASKVTKEVLNRTGGIEASKTRLEKWKKYCNDNIDENTIKDIVEKGYYQSLGASNWRYVSSIYKPS